VKSLLCATDTSILDDFCISLRFGIHLVIIETRCEHMTKTSAKFLGHTQSHTNTQGSTQWESENTRKYPDWNSVCAMAKVANACLKRLARLDRSKWNRSTIQARASTPRMTKHGKASARQRSGLSCCGHRSWLIMLWHDSYNFVVSVECERKIMTFTIRGLNSRRSVLIAPRPGYTACASAVHCRGRCRAAASLTLNLE
jgi:hypothetical protein